MNSANLAKYLVLSLVLAFSVVGCQKKPKNITYIPPVQRPGTSGDQPIGPTGRVGLGGGLNEDANVQRNPDGTIPQFGRLDPSMYNEDRATLSNQTVYFDFDSSSVKPSEQFKVEAVSNYLRGNGSVAIKVEGHCDERGTAEYNRALGERRALTIREQLVSLGIAPDRIMTISYGEDVPAVLGSDESAWQKNRRGEFVLLTPK